MNATRLARVELADTGALTLRMADGQAVSLGAQDAALVAQILNEGGPQVRSVGSPNLALAGQIREREGREGQR